MTLKSRFGVTEGYWKRHNSIDHTRVTISRVVFLRWILWWPCLKCGLEVTQKSLKVVPVGVLQGHWQWRGSIDHVWLSISPPLYTVVQKNAPTLADYNYDPVQSILIIFSKLFGNDHKSCLVVKFSTSPHICCHYTLWNTMLYFSLIILLVAKNAPTSDDHNFNKRYRILIMFAMQYGHILRITTAVW